MKRIIFRPLRRIKKHNKIVVASYLSWNKVRTADYNKFVLVINNEYRLLPPDEYVYNHKGELLFFYQYSPADVPVFNYPFNMELESIRDMHKSYGIDWGSGNGTNYNAPGMDCCGTPTFSHFTSDYLASNSFYLDKFEPLTVQTVVNWYGWFLFELKNANIKIKP